MIKKYDKWHGDASMNKKILLAFFLTAFFAVTLLTSGRIGETNAVEQPIETRDVRPTIKTPTETNEQNKQRRPGEKYAVLPEGGSKQAVTTPSGDPEDSKQPEEVKPQGPPTEAAEPVIIKEPAEAGGPKKPMVALTFDDGPHPVYTPRILDALKQNNAAATFFVQGKRVQANADIVNRMVQEGSEVGNHTWNHSRLTKLPRGELRSQLDKTQEAVFAATGKYPAFMRPSYGEVNEEVKKGAGLPLILWSVDTRDWELKNPDIIEQDLLQKVKDGDIVIMHDIYESSAVAAERIVAGLVARGFKLVTVSQLIESRGIELEAGKIYK